MRDHSRCALLEREAKKYVMCCHRAAVFQPHLAPFNTPAHYDGSFSYACAQDAAAELELSYDPSITQLEAAKIIVLARIARR